MMLKKSLSVQGSLLLTAALLAGTLLGACSPSYQANTKTKPARVNSASKTKTSAKPVVKSVETSAVKSQPVLISFAFTGDVLSHQPVVKQSRTANGSYDYLPLTHGLKEWISAADLGIHHQETVSSENNQNLSAYPNFNAPKSWIKSVKALGYDGASTASNHTIDWGEPGVLRTIKALQTVGLGVAGSNLTKEQDPIQYYQITKGGRTIKIAHLSNTCVLNAKPPVMIDKPWLVETDRPKRILELARKARDNGAQMVILSSHDGMEYTTQPTQRQKQRAQYYADSGLIDFMIMHHAHAPQPITKLSGGVNGQGMWVFYGLGNLLSAQQTKSPLIQVGVIAFLTATVDEKGKITIGPAGWNGVILDRERVHIYTLDRLQAQLPAGSSLSADKIKEYRDLLFKSVGTEAKYLPSPPALGQAGQVTVLAR